MQWRTSSHSGANGACVEVCWTKSTHSNPHGNCVEIAHTAESVHVRDTKHRTGPMLTIPSRQWSTFINQLT